MQKQQLFALVGATAIGISAVVAMRFYLDQQRMLVFDDAKKKVASEIKNIQLEQANQVSVLVAKKDIPTGATIEPESLEVKIIPSQGVQPNAVSSVDRVAGLVAIVPIAKGEQILFNKLSSAREAFGGASLSMATPVGKRAITIPIDNISSLAGMIKPGNYVDIIVGVPLPSQGPDGKMVTQAATVPAFQNVLILAVGQEIGVVLKKEDTRYKKEEKKEVASSPLITLALSPQEANLMSFIQEQGKVRLILRSPADSQVTPTQVANWEALLQSIMPRDTQQKGKMPGQKPEVNNEPSVPVASPKTVEVYRGMEKKVVNLSK